MKHKKLQTPNPKPHTSYVLTFLRSCALTVFFLFSLLIVSAQSQVVSKQQFFNIQQRDISKIIPAAERGDAIAQYNLAECYYLGKGVEKDEELALQWYKKAVQNKEKLSVEDVATAEANIKKIETDIANKFSFFAKHFVQDKINEWQKKDEYEKTSDWQKRVNEASRNEKTKEFYEVAKREYIAEKKKNINLKMEILGEYDADNETFLIKSEPFGNLLVKVPNEEAKNFKANWKIFSVIPIYFIENDGVGLEELVFTAPATYNEDGERNPVQSYKYSNNATLNYAQTKIDYNFAPIDFKNPDNVINSKGNQNISTVNVTAGRSDVGINIPETNTKNEHTLALIIANEKYTDEADVPYAINDGEVFYEYCLKTLGLEKYNVEIVRNATFGAIKKGFDRLSKLAKQEKGEANIIFYYAGHGVPDESTKSAYLLPTDGDGENLSTAYKLEDLYSILGDLPAKSVVVFLDACFSGAHRNGNLMAAARGVAIAAKEGEPTGNMVVFSATHGAQTAYPYTEKGHGMFTYFLLKKLQETQGETTLGELKDYICSNVNKFSLRLNKKEQTPTVTPSIDFVNWENLKLK